MGHRVQRQAAHTLALLGGLQRFFIPIKEYQTNLIFLT